jgi:hypothetical protein
MPAFPRSFIFSNRPLDNTPDLVHIPTPTGYLRASSEADVFVASNDVGNGSQSFLILIGYAIDLRNTPRTTPDVAEVLLRSALGSGFDAMLNDTYALLGRFTVICQIGGRWLVFADACGTRSTYYDRQDGRFWISSHSPLIAAEAGRRSIAHLLKTSKYGRPGDRTPYDAVRTLLPNFCIDPSLEDRPARFWPRRNRPTASVEEASSRLEALLLTAAEAIGSRWRPAVSLTAGLDSRVSFAAFKNNRDAVFFTYDRGAKDAMDLSVARALCSKFEAAHKRLDLISIKPDPQVEEIAGQMLDYHHIANLSSVYHRNFAGGNWIHVRSNLSEIGRAFWRQMAANTELSVERMEFLSRRDVLLSGSTANRNASLRLQAFQELGELLGYDLSDPTNPVLHGYDAWDLFYWEHRMGSWHSALIQSSDFGFDTAILFNARIILDTLLSVETEARSGSVLLKNFLQTNLPDATSIPINPGRSLKVKPRPRPKPQPQRGKARRETNGGAKTLLKLIRSWSGR